MKAMVLCAGLGTRLGEITRTTPKPLLQAGDRSILEHILANLSRHGFQQVAINLHFQAEQIRTALGTGSRLGVELTYSEEPHLLGTAGGVKKMHSFFSEEKAFLVHYGDVVTDENLSDMVAYHERKKALLTLLVHYRDRSNSAMELDSENRIREFWERPDPNFWQTRNGAWVNSGVLLVSPSVLDHIPVESCLDWPRDIFPSLLQSGRVFAYPLKGYRMAVDSPERLEQLRKDWADGRYRPAGSSPAPSAAPSRTGSPPTCAPLTPGLPDA